LRTWNKLLTQISHLPGNRRSGILAAYKQAPVMYKTAIRMSQPSAPALKALYDPTVNI
jgi:hypothetical protein